MAETTARSILMASLIAIAVITGSFSYIASYIPTGQGNFSDYNRSFAKFEEIRTNTEEISDSVKDADPSKGEEGLLSGLYESSFGAVRQGWTSITTMKDIISDLNQGGFPVKLPTWFTGLLIAIITLTLAFAIIASWRKWHV